MIEYGKIETLYERDKETFKVIPGKVRLPEAELIKRWLVTEKIDGTNIRVIIETGGVVTSIAAGAIGMLGATLPTKVEFRGRTDKVQVPPFLLAKLAEMLPPERCGSAFDDFMEVILYGEGYGARIQKGGGNYREGVSFRLFDVAVLNAPSGQWWWLEWENVQDVARKLGIETVPILGIESLDFAAGGVGDFSRVAAQENDNVSLQVEGIVARTDPMLFRRNGQRLMWKLKSKDFA